MQARQHTPREEYVLAFTELGLNWNWDGKEPVQNYIARECPHLLRVYDAEFLATAIESSGRDKP